MFLIVIAALLVVSARIAVSHKESILDSIAVAYAGLLMVMYILSFFRGLKALLGVAVIAIVYVAVRAFLDERRDKSSLGKELLKYGKVLVIPEVICSAAITGVVGVCTRQQVFTWWDDINFWSSDARQIYYLNGFSSKYGNVSPEFGDYPPVTSLAKWLFLQISPNEYHESLQFVGYFFLLLIFLFPLLARVRAAIWESELKNYVKVFLSVAATVLVALFPGVFNGIIYYGTPADVVMAVVYGALLLAIYDQTGHSKAFYYTRIGLFTAVLLLSKSVGFEWAIFALIFYILVAKREKEMVLSVIGAGAAFGSWLLFCFVNRRVAKLTGAGIKMATSGTYEAPENTMDKMRYFAEGFAYEPMHTDHNFNIDLSTLAMVVLIFAIIIIMYNMKFLGRNEIRKTALFTLITGIVAYGIVFLAHISLFQGEDQYLDPYAMGISISRYCAPFTLGMTYLLAGISFNRVRSKSGKKSIVALLALSAAFVIVCADYSGVYKYLAGYKAQAADNRAYVADMVGDDGRELIEATSDRRFWGKRILVMRDGHEYYWVHNTYISKEASPVALVYDVFLTDEDSADSMVRKINESHASFIYIEDKELFSKELFASLMDDGVEFESGRVYRIIQNGDGLKLGKCE